MDRLLPLGQNSSVTKQLKSRPPPQLNVSYAIPAIIGKRNRFFLFRMERSAEERTKYPDRINLDRRGLHGIPVLADEPGLRLLRCCNNFFLYFTTSTFSSFNNFTSFSQFSAQFHQENPQSRDDQQTCLLGSLPQQVKDNLPTNVLNLMLIQKHLM